MANEDARDNGVLGKALGMAAVVGGMGAGGYFGGKAVMKAGKGLYKGGKKAVSEMADAWSTKGFNKATEEGSKMYNGMKNHSDEALKNVINDSSSISRDYAKGEGSSHIIANAIAETDTGNDAIKIQSKPRTMNTPKNITYKGKNMDADGDKGVGQSILNNMKILE